MTEPFVPPSGSGSSRIGDELIAQGVLSREQVEQILALQQSAGLRFGEAAIRLDHLSERQVQRILSQQFGYATALSSDTEALAVTLAITDAPLSQEAEAIRQIRANLATCQDEDGCLTVAVLSPTEGEGKTYLASSLAIAFAQTGQSTLLVNANLRPSGQPEPLRPRHHDNATGLSTLLAGRIAEPPIRTVPGYPELSVLDAGPTPPNTQEILAEPALRRLHANQRERNHIILLDTPAATSSSDALVIARQARNAILVGRRDLTRLNHLQQVERQLVSHGVTLLGTVYNTFDSTPATTSARSYQERLQRLLASWRQRLASRRA
ncbi:MAG: capsular biosynthesis protein [Pigmentiphaga sp.]